MDRVRFVEVKAGKDAVHEHQQVVHEKLRKLGMRVDVIKFNGDSHWNLAPGKKRRSYGDGGLIQIFQKRDPLTGEKRLRSPFWYAVFYDLSGKQVRFNTKQKVKAEAVAVLRRCLVERDRQKTVALDRLS